MKRQRETPSFINEYAGFETYWSSRKLRTISWTGVKGKHISTGDCPSRDCPSVPFCFTSVSITLPASPSLPPPSAMFFLFCSTTSSYLRRATRENNAASCFAMQWQTGFLCAVIRPPFLREQTSPVADRTAIPRARFTGNQSTHGWCHFSTAISLCDQYWLQNDKSRQKKVSFVSLSKGSVYFFRCWSDKTINWPRHQISAIALVTEIITDKNDGKKYKSKL